MKIAIVGSREYPDLEAVRRYVEKLDWDTIVVSGGAKGVDQAAEFAAGKRRMVVVVHRPDWTKHGKAAGHIRNWLIVKEADRIVVFWDGQSKGADSVIKLAHKYKKPLEVYCPGDTWTFPYAKLVGQE